jgi:hypothetical protein
MLSWPFRPQKFSFGQSTDLRQVVTGELIGATAYPRVARPRARRAQKFPFGQITNLRGGAYRLDGVSACGPSYGLKGQESIAQALAWVYPK